MLTQLQLEGPDLEPLLDRVRSEFGGSARIISAEKVRSGGIAGFFARQRFELTVEVDDEQSARVSAPAASVPAGPRPDQSAPSPMGPDAAAPRSLLELADQVSDEEQGAVVSTQFPSFASLLSQLGAAVGDGEAAAGSVPDPSAPTPSAATPARNIVVPQQPAPSSTALAAASPPGAEVSRSAAARTTSARPVTTDVEGSGTGAELARLGLPAHLRPAGSGEQLHSALRASLAKLPTAPPATNRAGAVLAIVGPLDVALRVARELAQDLGLPPATAVAVATSRGATPDVPERQVLRETSDAADRRATWRRRSNLTIVAVEGPLTSTGAADARGFLSVLAPSTTWGAVEATRKAQDIAAWTRALGGVHALALTDVEDTVDPAAVLALGIPVARLGARPATARAWATLLTGRLAA